MPARYTVMQYLPDPITGERLNIGIIAWDSSGVGTRFLENWSRARSFAGKNIDFLRELTEELQEHLKAQWQQTPNEEALNRFFASRRLVFQSSVQFSEPQGSLEEAGLLLLQLSKRLLRDAPPRRRIGRTKNQAVQIAYSCLLDAVGKYSSEADRLVHRKAQLQGKFENHRFDLVMKNGHDVAGVNALSFEVKDTDVLGRDIDALAYSLIDVRKQQEKLPLALYLLPGSTENVKAQRLEKRAEAICSQLDADLLRSEAALGKWAAERAVAFRH